MLSLPLRQSGRPSDVYECRRCGTTLDDPADDCPYGCRSSVAHYEL